MKLKKIKIPVVNWKRILSVSIWVISISGLTVLLGFAGKEKNRIKCNAVKINISDENENEFITKNDVLDLLNSKGKQPVNKLMNDINIGVLEKLVNSNPYVANAEVFSTIDGTLNIDIRQRNPIIRIINNKDEHFYIDNQGEFMPVSLNYSAPVVAASGFIFDSYAGQKISRFEQPESDTLTAKPLINQLYDLAKFITNDQFWNAQIEQVYVNSESEIELIPRIGNHRIVLGNASQLAEKFKKLMIFYKEGLNKTGWNNYSIINLKFANQVVCTKADFNYTSKTKTN